MTANDNTASLNRPIANFDFVTTQQVQISFEQLLGKHVVLYFYPKDDTPGCTQEGMEFSELYPEFVKLNAEIFGVSRDSLKSHANFICKYAFPFDLICDAQEQLCDYFGVMKMKSLYGKSYRGIERSTFLIDHSGVLRQEWRNVKVPGHAAQVLAALKLL